MYVHAYREWCEIELILKKKSENVQYVLRHQIAYYMDI